MRVFEFRKNKSTEKDESTSGTMQVVDVYHLSQVTNIALLLTPCLDAVPLLPTEAYEFV